ncbi:hypothetical protein Nepgr_011419 [Nepenthes gracilis]|uniref:Uncharacterized protein n=1 Tax=Nepenthes gracilis TaxID=150966 RepID=A0AAD3SEB0_NEPGR|nr:hypothetical protein Nepgr_011419 [Nepenthes gracilis]
MHRSSSNTRVSDEFLKYSSSAPSQGSNRCSIDNVNGSSSNQLPVYNPISPSAKKEKSRLRSAENAIHVIPLVLLLCAIILWFCSNPVDMVRKDDLVVARAEGLKVAGAFDIDGTQNSLLTHLEEVEDVDRAAETIASEADISGASAGGKLIEGDISGVTGGAAGDPTVEGGDATGGSDGLVVDGAGVFGGGEAIGDGDMDGGLMTLLGGVANGVGAAVTLGGTVVDGGSPGPWATVAATKATKTARTSMALGRAIGLKD